MSYLIGLDLGTTTIKATLFDETGIPLAEDSIESSLLFPEPGYIEQSAPQWYDSSAAVIRKTLARAGIAAAAVSGISISSQGITIVPVDENGHALYNAISWMDVRPEAQKDTLASRFGEKLLIDVTGKPLKAYYSIYKMMWFADTLPEVYKKTRLFLMPMDYMTMRFCGRAVTDHSMAAGTAAYSLLGHDWDDDIITAAGIKRSMFPEIKWSGEIAGNLTEQAARDTGLTTDCVVAVGGQDQKVAAYGTRLKKGAVTFSMGTSGTFEFILNGPTPHPKNKIPLCPHSEPNLWVLEGCINSLGGAIKWSRDTICAGLSYKEMDTLAEGVQAGSGGVVCYPFFTGQGVPHPASDRLARFDNIGLHTGRAELVRALYEGIAYECRLNIEASAPVSGKITCIHAFSGGSKSGILCQIIADVTGCAVRSYSFAEMGSLGAARLAARAGGMDAEEFGAGVLSDYTEKHPSGNTRLYSALYGEYIKGL